MKQKKPASVPYEPILLEELKDPEYAALFLTACMEGDSDEDFEVFFGALNKILKARGISHVAKEMGLTRDALYKVFTKHNNPRFRTLVQILRAAQIDIAFVPRS